MVQVVLLSLKTDRALPVSLVSNINHVSFASPYSVDKIVRIFTGSYNRASDVVARSYTLAGSPYTAYFYRIAHGLTRPLACEMIDSIDGELTYRDAGIDRIALSDSTYIYIFDAQGSKGVGTVNYKVWGSWIDDYDATNPLVSTITYSSRPIQFDSRVNYQKIFDQNVLNFTAGTFGASETQSVGHPFSYTPNAKVWFEAFTGEVWPLNAGGLSNPFNVDDSQDECQLFIDSDSVDIKMLKFSGVARRAWYKVYYDSN